MDSPPPLLFPTHDGCGVLAGTVVDTLGDALRAGPTRRFSKGETVWDKGDAADAMFFLHLGAVEVSQGGPGGLLMHRAAPGEPFGMLCLCAEGGGVRPSSACVVADSEVTSLGLADVLGHLQRSQPVLLSVVGGLCERAVEAEARAEILTHRDAEGRLARLLLHLARVQAADDRDGPVRLALTHDQLARLAAMSRPHVSVVLGEFRDRGLVAYTPGRPLVPDVDALQALVAAGEAHASRPHD
ncbi:Crp/Fnr family transcriptional regulator [Rubrivirga sp. S365]|uniref:Crp/Fnr family transcriptional regulator n=1 Tax=Rubrivirga sp. S365 TaxID=3076080 RepID=UPI0028CA5F8E|nr:Crp/Fnr family transcriptional regulator [Rubrivirga sp. S365]MDT7858369.1 Crp/Fnr family transcriptional regulator [Rubrivirga sp. S365]